jgi:hypothetical protein
MLQPGKVVRQLKQERDQTRVKLQQLDTALKVLGEVTANGRTQVRADGNSGTPRTMSRAARRKIAAAQRARWAKWKALTRKRKIAGALCFDRTAGYPLFFSHLDGCFSSSRELTSSTHSSSNDMRA